MKVFKLLIFTVFLSVGLNALAGDDWAQFGRFSHQNDSLKNIITAQRPKAVFIGNSITEGWLSGRPQFFETNDFIGRGISGQTTHQMLVRFREDVINLNPEIVVINGGTNDIAENNHTYNPDITFGNLVSMAELASANGIKVVLTSLLPAEKYSWRPDIKGSNEKIKSLNKKICDYAISHGYDYVDYYALMHQDDVRLDPRWSQDGVHPNNAGYEVMESIILPVINGLNSSTE